MYKECNEEVDLIEHSHMEWWWCGSKFVVENWRTKCKKVTPGGFIDKPTTLENAEAHLCETSRYQHPNNTLKN